MVRTKTASFLLHALCLVWLVLICHAGAADGAPLPDPPDEQTASSGFMSSLMSPLNRLKSVVTLSKIGYNRVEGLFLGVSPPKLEKSRFELSGHVGYGFQSEAWRYEVGLLRSWFWMNRLEIGAAYHDLTDSQDQWKVSGLECFLGALLFREDLQDYFHRKGWRLFAVQNVSEIYRFGLEFRRDRYGSMEKETNWSIFGGNRKFRDNPPVIAGRMESLVLTAQADLMGYQEGWIFQGEYEKAGEPFSGDFDFHRLRLLGKRYQKTFGQQQAVMRLIVGLGSGSRPDTLPEQKCFDLGGIETLPGYSFKEFQGDRLILGNVHYLFGSDVLGRSGIPFVRSLQPILFVDSGMTCNHFKGQQLGDMKTDVGVAVADLENTFRINVARRLDRGDDPVVVSLRLLRRF